MPVLKNVPVKWASLTTPNTTFEPCWEVEVQLTQEQADALQAEAKALHPKGIKIKDGENGMKTFRFRRKLHNSEGNPNTPPTLIGPDGKEGFNRLVGNGSICNVQYALVAYNNPKFGKGVTNDLKGIRVITHVPFGEQDGDGLFDDEPSTPDNDDVL